MPETAYVVFGLGNGDEGKGTNVEFLARKYGAATVVRYLGGSQPAHNVISPEGVHHCSAQFSSGVLVNGVRTFLSRFVLVDPIDLLVERNILRVKLGIDPFYNLTIDERCPVITPYHKYLNQIKEIDRGESRHGSCGKGVGEAAGDLVQMGQQMLFIRDLRDEKICRQKVNFIRQMKLDLAEQLCQGKKKNLLYRKYLGRMRSDSYLSAVVGNYIHFAKYFCQECGLKITDDPEILKGFFKNGPVIFEGAQGVLLDQKFGFAPYITRANTTTANADQLLEEINFPKDQIQKIGVLRPYATRHGAGPLVTEDPDLTKKIPDLHNGVGEWQGAFRIGWFDMVMARYALEVSGPIDYLSITNFDRIREWPTVKVADSYSVDGQTLRRLDPAIKNKAELLSRCQPNYSIVDPRYILNLIAAKLKTPIGICSLGPTATDKIMMR